MTRPTSLFRLLLLLLSVLSLTSSCSFHRRIALQIFSSSFIPVPNAQVLLTIDTASLISSGRLRDDCSDMLFSSDPRAHIRSPPPAISHWFESSCGSTSTRIWLELPVLPVTSPSVPYTVFLFHDDSSCGYSPASRLTWTPGSLGFISMKLSYESCNAVLSLRDRFLRPFSNWEPGPSPTATHSHDVSGILNSASESVEIDSESPSVQTPLKTHTHAFDGVSEPIEMLPPFVSVLLCSSPYLEPVDDNSAFMFDLPADQALENALNVTTAHNFTDKYVRGWDGVDQGEIGTVMGSAEHSHGFYSSECDATSAPYISPSMSRYVDGNVAASHHTHSVSGQLDFSSNLPEFFSFRFGIVGPHSVHPSNYTILLADTLPPLGWEHHWVSLKHFDGFNPLIRGASEFGLTGGSRTHSHSQTVSGVTQQVDDQVKATLSMVSHSISPISHSHVGSTAGITTEMEVVLDYYRVVLIRRRDDLEGKVVDVGRSIGLDDLTCDGVVFTDDLVCDGHGDCLGNNECLCDDNWQFDVFCSVTVCDGVFSNETEIVCGGHGKCVDLDECRCERLYEQSPFCRTRNQGIDSSGEGVLVVGVIGGVAACLVLAVIFAAFGLITLAIVRRNRRSQQSKTTMTLPLLQTLDGDSSSQFSDLRISSHLTTVDPEQLVLQRRLGANGGGSGSSLFIADLQGTEVVAKVFTLSSVTTQEDVNRISLEASLMMSVKHPHVLSVIGVCCSLPRLSICLEYARNGDLKTFLFQEAQKSPEKYSFETKIVWLKEIASGMEFLHSPPRCILHRDLKPENVWYLCFAHTSLKGPS